jgi:hypothetical protein
MLSEYIVKVRVYNDISVPGEGLSLQCYQCTWCRLKYRMLSVYLVQVNVYNAISVPGAA